MEPRDARRSATASFAGGGITSGRSSADGGGTGKGAPNPSRGASAQRRARSGFEDRRPRKRLRRVHATRLGDENRRPHQKKGAPCALIREKNQPLAPSGRVLVLQEKRKKKRGSRTGAISRLQTPRANADQLLHVQAVSRRCASARETELRPELRHALPTASRFGSVSSLAAMGVSRVARPPIWRTGSVRAWCGPGGAAVQGYLDDRRTVSHSHSHSYSI